MTIEKKMNNDTATLIVSGRLDTQTAPELEAELKQAKEELTEAAEAIAEAKEKLKKVKKSILISDPPCSFYYTETIHQIRVQMERARETKQQSVFVVASCSENEGKSTVAANLALSLAQKHRKVLLLDADTRKPAQHLIFEAEVEKGKNIHVIGDACKVGNLRTVIWQAWDVCMKL